MLALQLVPQVSYTEDLLSEMPAKYTLEATAEKSTTRIYYTNPFQ